MKRKHYYRYDKTDYLTAIAGFLLILLFLSILDGGSIPFSVALPIALIVVAVREFCKWSVLTSWLNE